MALGLVTEAHVAGARLKMACEAMGLSVSTYRRWDSGQICDNRKGSEKSTPRKLSIEEQIAIIDACCSPEFKNWNIYEIHVYLLDRGTYLGSVSTFYRVMRQYNLVRPRRNTKASERKNRPPERKATGPNQVWTWDITWVKSVVNGLFYYAYVIIDIWDRSRSPVLPG